MDFYDTVRELELSIIDNGEPISWRPIIAFMSGAFWLLSFIKDPYKKHGDRSPLSFVHDKVLDSAVLGYAPR